MLLFTATNTEENINVTLTEKVILTTPFYLFHFLHVETRQVVAFVLSDEDDISVFPERFNQFVIDCTDVFNMRPDGQWIYKVYEQEDEDNIDPAEATTLLEQGKMQLTGNRPAVYTMYQSTTTFNAYNGE